MINPNLFSVSDIRRMLVNKYKAKEYTIDKTCVKTVELIGMSFIASDDTIFGTVNEDYISREFDWYLSRSLFVKDIPGDTPAIWNQVASVNGEINSNYGYLALSEENGAQFANVCNELRSNKDSRRANMIYTRPSMHTDYNRDGMSDFICTNTVQYFIRDSKVSCIVNMRSNDAWAGYRNDYAWQKYMLGLVAMDLYGSAYKEFVGDIVWQVGSLHLYEKQFYLLDHFSKTGEYRVTKKDVDAYE